MSQFSTKWNNNRGPGLSDRVKEVIKPEGPVKPKLEQAVRQIKTQITKKSISSSMNYGHAFSLTDSNISSIISFIL